MTEPCDARIPGAPKTSRHVLDCCHCRVNQTSELIPSVSSKLLSSLVPTGRRRPDGGGAAKIVSRRCEYWERA